MQTLVKATSLDKPNEVTAVFKMFEGKEAGARNFQLFQLELGAENRTYDRQRGGSEEAAALQPRELPGGGVQQYT